jgi:choline dehydrogenase-like flavoprotein
MTQLATIRSNPRVIDGAAAAADVDLSADVCVIGTGAGGAVAAATLAQAGLDVVMIEEGGYYTSADFTMKERECVPRLYQENATRATADAGISLLQGRAVGGSTVVNWTTCFRTPEDVVAYWSEHYGVKGFAYADLVPHYEAIEARLAIAQVPLETCNANNRTLYDGCKALGWSVETLRRNVHACFQSGFCHLGCPVNAKRSMLVTMVPDAIDEKARLLFRARADRLETDGNTVAKLRGTLLDSEGRLPTGRTFVVRAKRFVVSGGALNSPALLLRSGLDSGGLVGARTFVHPAVGSLAFFDHEIRPFQGAPQSAASHHFARRGADVGFFLEAVPWYPGLAATAVPGFGAEHATTMRDAVNMALHVAIMIDGFHDDVAGGRVTLRPSGAPVLDYPIVSRLWAAMREAQKRLAEAELAAGARRVMTLHATPGIVADRAAIDNVIEGLRWETGSAPVFSAHLMGGCAMGDDPARSVVRSSDLRHHTMQNLYVIDGSVFPTSLGVNPSESIYGLARLMAMRLSAAK